MLCFVLFLSEEAEHHVFRRGHLHPLDLRFEPLVHSPLSVGVSDLCSESEAVLASGGVVPGCAPSRVSSSGLVFE